jgi:hypothetical protein
LDIQPDVNSIIHLQKVSKTLLLNYSYASESRLVLISRLAKFDNEFFDEKKSILAIARQRLSMSTFIRYALNLPIAGSGVADI